MFLNATLYNDLLSGSFLPLIPLLSTQVVHYKHIQWENTDDSLYTTSVVISKSLERDQSHSVLSEIVQGRRSLVVAST
jgi:hypothetical protein